MPTRVDLSRLSVFRPLENDVILRLAIQFLTQPSDALSHELRWRLLEHAETFQLEGPLFHSYLFYRLLTTETILSRSAEQSAGNISAGLHTLCTQDLALLSPLWLQQQLTAAGLNESHSPSVTPWFPPPFAALHRQLWQTLPAAPELLSSLIDFYALNGCDTLATSAALRWTSHAGLQPLRRYDPVRLEHLVGCDEQKHALLANTQSLLAGKPSHHVLLCGARGTGKSSAVKGLLHQFSSQGLRLIEITKESIGQLEQLVELLAQRSPKFILFLDDLSFEQNETEYKHLKSVMEGGLSPLPSNVRIYATSNRRHLIRETFSDRGDSLDEMHGIDTVNEKISLVDRFGLTLTFFSPTQGEFQAIVRSIAERHNLSVSEEDLRQKALRWEMSHSGRSGRIAKQLIEDLLSHHS